MIIYLVGGAVRDQLLDIPGHESAERDWVVTGATSQEMLAAGYQQVGKDFPVFLHPVTREEYALARIERKTGAGHTGFECNSDPSVSIEDDLLRRDLTINAIARDSSGNLVDPYSGVSDLGQRILRHVSPAFCEDPLRVLRVARFAARFHTLGFTIAGETLALMQTLSQSGELEHLPPERIWKETEKALQTASPHIFIRVLRDCGALKVLFPELDCLFGIPQPKKHHPEIDTGIHTLMALQQAAKISNHIAARFAALTHDLGKGLTPPSEWPRHLLHEKTGKKPVRQLCQRLRVPNHCMELALLVCEFHLHTHRALELKPSTIQKLFVALDIYRRPERLEPFLAACEADARGRNGLEESDYPQKAYLEACFGAARQVTAKSIDTGNLSGKEIGMAIEAERIKAISAIKQAHRQLHTATTL